MSRYCDNAQKILTIAREENSEAKRFIYYLGFNNSKDTNLGKEIKKVRITKSKFEELSNNSNESIKETFSITQSL